MHIILLPDWKITLFIKTVTPCQKKIISFLLDNYTEFIKNKYDNDIPDLHKVLKFDNYYNLSELKSSLKNNKNNSSGIHREHELKVLSILNHNKNIGFIVKPDHYLFLNYTKNDQVNSINYDKYCLNLLKDVKKNIWLTNHDLQPQWYLLSNNSNQNITNINFFQDLTVLKEYIPDQSYNKLITNFEDLNFKNEDNFINNDIKSNLNNLEYNDYKLLVQYYYQNDYFFIKEFNQTDKCDYNYRLIKSIKSKYDIKNINKKNPIFTIITPTMGTETLYRLKQVLKQESISFIHLILWDNNRRPNSNGKYIDPSDLEDENTFCYHFRHPYFEFRGQRNDVWLRGVGATLTNTPYITYFDDDTWPERDHLKEVMNYMVNKKINYTYVIRRMWENHHKSLGLDNFEAIGIKNKFGFRLIDNSSIYMKLEVARKVHNVFLAHQVYGDDRFTPDFLDSDKECKGERMEQVLVNHIAKDKLLNYFKQNVSQE